jgi:rhodanese-related sulfurtransferase
MSQLPDKPTVKQAACLLLASVGLGLAGNALNPAGLRWGEANTGFGPNREEGAGRVGIYRNETLYENETVSASLAPRNAQTAARTDSSTPIVTSPGIATPLRSTWAEVKPLVERGRTVLVDARSRTSFDAGHIPGAASLPFTSLQTDIQAFMARYPPATTPLAIYCANANCGTSGKLAAALTHNYKYKDVRYLPGGYQEWRFAEGK